MQFISMQFISLHATDCNEMKRCNENRGPADEPEGPRRYPSLCFHVVAGLLDRRPNLIDTLRSRRLADERP